MKAEPKSQSITWTISLLIAACLVSVPVQAKYGGGAGMADDPYQIWTAEHMNAIGVDPCDLDNHFRLMVDIDMAGEAGGEIRVIGDSEKPFKGSFDGNGHTISHLACNCTSKDNVGLFGYVDGIDAEIRNLGLIEPDVQASTGDNVGSLVGQLKDGVVTGCYVQGGSVSGNQMVGGLVGCNHGTITNSYATCSVAGASRVGGFVGANGPCGRGDEGCSLGTILVCYSSGPVMGADRVGGFVGTTQGSIRDCLWDTETSGQVSSAGGTGKTTAEMQDPAAFYGTAWDFFGFADGPSEVWTRDPVTQYPVLWWQVPEAQWSPLPTFSGGTGTLDDPYLISSAGELSSIGHNPRLVNCCFRLANDIDMSQVNSFPIGSQETPFAGVFDGNNKVLVHFICSYLGGYNIGVFGCVQGPNALVRDLGVIDPYVEDNPKGSGAGGLVGYLSQGTIANCFVEGGSVSGDYDAGGLVGVARFGDVQDCHSTAAVSSYYRAGGLIGRNQAATVTRCHATGTVLSNGEVGGLLGTNASGSVADCYATGDITGGNFVGGLVGLNGGTLLNCHAMGRVTAEVSGRQMIGGLVGRNEGAIISCHATGDVEGSDDVGGLVGQIWPGSVTNCYATGSVRAERDGGGLVGFCTGRVSGSYATGAVSTDESAGGLVGCIINGRIADSYATGGVTGRSGVGGLVGILNGDLSHCYSTGRVTGVDYVSGLASGGGNEDVEACFWDTQTSSQSTSRHGQGKTTAQMQTAKTFLDAGWDFVSEMVNGTEDIWWIDEGKDYPRLWWEQGDEMSP